MINYSLFAPALALVLLISLPPVISAQESRLTMLHAPPDSNESGRRNRVGVSYRMGFNITADFRSSSGPSASSNPGPATGGAVERFYDDGYNRVDSSGNFGDTTWFWGYENPSQMAGDGIVMTSSSSSRQYNSRGHDGDPQHGLELVYNRVLGRLGRGLWGLEGAFGFTPLTIRDNRALAADRIDIADTYPSGGIVVPAAPYAGTQAGPGPMIGSVPGRTVTIVAGGSTLIGERRLDMNLYGFRLGPFYELPLTERVALSLSGGLALGAVESRFGYQERWAGGGFQSGRGSRSDLLVGGYLAGNLSYALTESLHLFTGLQFQHLDGFTQRVDEKSAKVDFGKSLYVTLGFGVRF
jgi:hypothetical protein